MWEKNIVVDRSKDRIRHRQSPTSTSNRCDCESQLMELFDNQISLITTIFLKNRDAIVWYKFMWSDAVQVAMREKRVWAGFFVDWRGIVRCYGR